MLFFFVTRVGEEPQSKCTRFRTHAHPVGEGKQIGILPLLLSDCVISSIVYVAHLFACSNSQVLAVAF